MGELFLRTDLPLYVSKMFVFISPEAAKCER
ncbi:hypothetical protein COHCIP112018_01490 [Cohnella sp. JJ-181]|nr:hypothetical protein COHCIP112018_01490 [Cohnella sp. JJ-181]